MTALLKVNNLTTYIGKKKKQKHTIIDNVSFDINKGENVGIVGESGCGKSMTALSVMQLLPKEIGISEDSSVTLFGKDILGIPNHQMRKIRGNEISMIFQEPMTSLNPLMKIGRQIQEIVQLHMKTSKDKSKETAIELLESVGIPNAEESYDKYPHELSGGMRQRVMISIAMACNPKLLIADEPTTALDVTIQAQILELMKKLKHEYNTSIMMITHDLGVVAEMCERVIIMYAGKIVETADVETLFANPQHPYTKGLIASLPAKKKGQKRLSSIPGNVPPIKNRPKGCRFAPRCSYAMDICSEIEPHMFELEDNHASACWLHDSNTIKKEADMYE